MEYFKRDDNGKTVIVVDMLRCHTSTDAAKIANKHFKTSLSKLHVRAGIRKGIHVETIELDQRPNCWMVWR